ncbi:Endonuclease/exonuclease/phosphatase superfamily [Arabidopsis thaliana x Arabidopsis arenosa]|uniref:Endonuclease/exonuclease/phosphatase superfamily n=1 Tax=Arabidopsis thaliana x Arabidopsis arenosa TaxID=1240361 RepID=A0A8T2CBP2_9BRAS|nr:Endonuclease/exonuclease/phosphatase superfamily [Arabidopsis thaliana x Arabidopsis arenosa]
MPKKKKKAIRGVVPGSSKFAAVHARAAALALPLAAAGRRVSSSAVSKFQGVPNVDPSSSSKLVSADPSLDESSGVVQASDLSLTSDLSASTVDGSASGVVKQTATAVNRGLTAGFNAQSTVASTDLAISSQVPSTLSAATKPSPPLLCVVDSPAAGKISTVAADCTSAPATKADQSTSTSDSWVDMVKGSSKKLTKRGSGFTLPSGELCVKIPNDVIERNKKCWDSFILGQFYSDPPSQGTLHNIVNGIWSRQYRDISVSRMEGNAFLFRIPNSFTRSRVLNQRLWQIEGQTMFVANWEPGFVPVKPELSSAPIWLELRNVPFQFFHEEGLEQIAGLVGDPKFLHPSTANKTNLEVAKVFTIIDPRKPLPEAVNVQFQSGEICRVLVSSPWMPPVCSHCKEIGHTLKHCKAAPTTCTSCSSTTHSSEACPKLRAAGPKKRRNQRTRRSKSPAILPVSENEKVKGKGLAGLEWQIKAPPKAHVKTLSEGSGCAATATAVGLPGGEVKQLLQGEQSFCDSVSALSDSRIAAGESQIFSSDNEVEEDSSDVLSTDPEEEKFIRVHRSGFKKWFKANRPLFGGVIETHVKQPKDKKFINALLPGWSFEENYDFSVLGKIWVLWDPSVQVVTVAKSLQMITCEVLLPNSLTWIVVSVVYAANEDEKRRELWKEISDLGASQTVANRPWIMLGDFNQVLHPHEHSKHVSLNVDRRIRDFRDCLLDAELSDLVYKGNSFTWWNKSKSRPVAKKIDRILVNDSWSALFPSSFGLFGAPDFSDHASCGVVLEEAAIKAKRPFKFFNFLLRNPEFLNLIRDSWYSLNVVGSAMFRVSKKLKALKKPIKDFSKLNYSNLELRTKEAHDTLLHFQNLTLADPSVANAEQELDAERKWHVLSSAEESFFLQRSRVSWFAEGDSNTRYFHRMADSRKSLNTITTMFDESGLQIDTQKGIIDHCANYFETLLGDENGPFLLEQEDMNLLLTYRCSPVQCSELEAVFTDNEIKAAFFSLPRNKACGPDGFPAEFFKESWCVIGPEVTAAVREFFISGRLLKQWNATTLVLIPKSPNASCTSDFRPISCMNTMYKVIARLLTSRLQKLLSCVISPFQSAFLPGRLLAENVLLATEMVHGYNWRNISPRGMLKVDLRKAFDSVRWDFIISALRALGIPVRFINWIHQCISTPTFTISVNGSCGGFFKSTKGLRQGDPLSPYLFVLAMEVFSKLLHSRFASGYIRYHPKASDISISHLMFADDVMIFFDGGSSSLHGICETLDDFASWSGLQVNKDKSQLFHAGIGQIERDSLAEYGFPQGSLPVRYLGLPLMCRKLRIAEYEPLLEKITKRFRAWATKCLSYAGRVQLIVSVIYGSVNFWMTTFLLPKGCIKKIESLCSRFLWAGNIDEGKGSKVSWAQSCLPKSEGGLGLRRFSEWNKTLCLRLIWLLFNHNGSLWASWHRHHHLRNKSFWAVAASPSDPWSWKMLLNLRPLAEQFVKCKVGNGLTAFYWYDSWTTLGPLIKCVGDLGTRTLRIPLSARVADAHTAEGWKHPLSRSAPAQAIHDHISSLPAPSSVLFEDSFLWCVGDFVCRGFSAAATWETLRPKDTEKDWAALVWFKGAVPKHAFNMWVSHLDRLPTRQRLASWGQIQSVDCCLCTIESESRDHLLLNCEFASQIWKLVFFRICPRQRIFSSWAELLSWIRLSSASAPSLLRKITAQAIIYNIWRQRNNVLHNAQRIAPQIIFKIVDREVRNIITSRRHRKRWRKLMILWIQ